jgi:multiple sugar transport system permease protein
MRSAARREARTTKRHDDEPEVRVRRYETVWAWLFVAPAVLGFVLFAVGPIAASLVMSFTDWPIIAGVHPGTT